MKIMTLLILLFLQAPLPSNINAKTIDGVRPIDIAVIYGSWDIYKFLIDNGAKFTADTFLACCSDDRYKDVKRWAERIRSRYSCEKPSSKTKKRILNDLYERYVRSTIFRTEPYCWVRKKNLEMKFLLQPKD